MSAWLGVIGWPVAHSLSPPMQEAGLRALGLDWRYGAFPVRSERLGEAVRGAAALGFVGLNVTVPHKEAAVALCEPDEEARALGAVNTLVFDATGGPGATRPRGHNTDLHGFRMLLAEAGVAARGKRALVLGAGGAARAVVRVLLDEGADVQVATRSGRRLRLAHAPELEHLDWSGPLSKEILGACELLVDATPRGLDPTSAFDLGALPRHATVLDLVVRPTTPLVATARARGLRAETGAAMLLHQGARSLSLWTGRPAPIAEMRAALDAALAH